MHRVITALACSYNLAQYIADTSPDLAVRMAAVSNLNKLRQAIDAMHEERERSKQNE